MCVVVWVFILFGKVACCSFFFSFYTGCTFFPTFFFVFLFCCIALIVANFHFTLGRVAFSDSRQSVRQSLEAQSTKQKLHERSAPTPPFGPTAANTPIFPLFRHNSTRRLLFVSSAYATAASVVIVVVVGDDVFVAVASWLTSDNILLAYRCKLRLFVAILVVALLWLHWHCLSLLHKENASAFGRGRGLKSCLHCDERVIYINRGS